MKHPGVYGVNMGFGDKRLEMEKTHIPLLRKKLHPPPVLRTMCIDPNYWSGLRRPLVGHWYWFQHRLVMVKARWLLVGWKGAKDPARGSHLMKMTTTCANN